MAQGSPGRAPLSHEQVNMNNRIIDELFDYSFLVSGLIQCFKVPTFQSFKSPKLQSFKISKLQSFKISRLQISQSSKVTNFHISSIQKLPRMSGNAFSNMFGLFCAVEIHENKMFLKWCGIVSWISLSNSAENKGAEVK